MKTKTKISGYILRSAAAMLLFSCVVVALSSAISLPNHPAKLPTPQDNTAFSINRHESASSVAESVTQRDRTLTFSDRVAYQRAIEEVYWRHRIWPKENASPKPPLDAVMSQAQIEKKVEDYLRNSQLLEQDWQKPITPEQLQAEMDRMARDTKQPDVLRELFEALGNDPSVIADCLARPALAERLLTTLYAQDERFHEELKRRAEAELAVHQSLSQMKQTNGTYTEAEWLGSDTAEADLIGSTSVVATPLRGVGRDVPQARGYAGNAVKLTNGEWQQNVKKLVANLGVRSRQRGIAALKSADVSAHSKNDAAESEPASNPQADDYESISVGKLSQLQEDENAYYAAAVISKDKDRLKLATIAWMKQPFDSWRTKAGTQVPVTMAAVSHGYTLPEIPETCTDDTWTATTTTNAPSARTYHTAVWTGSEMIVWGGYPDVNTGGKYNPSTDSWIATSTINAPEGRRFHTAVWTGSEMIVWGGRNAYGNRFNTGARYNPGTDTWTATSTTNSPVARDLHAAIWTGSEMIVWGGEQEHLPFEFNTGGRYNPSTDTWTATSTTNAPEARHSHTAIWTGSEMIIWGGLDVYTDLNTGGRYNPSTDTWTATSTTNAPEVRSTTAVWTGNEMIVWGGEHNGTALDTGGRYNPNTNTWAATSNINTPHFRHDHTAVWTGSAMIIWGGRFGAGRGENTGGRYNPITDTWTATSTSNAPSAREYHTAVWTGTQMIVWGGFDGSYLNTGGRYCAQVGPVHPAFFNGETALGGGWYYLQFANGTPFGYYNYLSDQNFIYHIDLGFEYLFDGQGGGIYFYDFASSSFFYTSPSTFPYLYDFSLNAWLYYLPDANNPGRYTHNPRWFFNFATGQWITL